MTATLLLAAPETEHAPQLDVSGDVSGDVPVDVPAHPPADPPAGVPAAGNNPPEEGPPLERLRAQDHGAFDALVARHYGAVHRYLARLLGDPDAAAELAQDTFLRAYQSTPRLEDGANISGWLFRIATNLARQHHRHRRLIRWSDVSHLDREAGQPSSPGRFEERVLHQDAIRQALERLPLGERIVLLLYAWTGYSCPEIAHIVGKSTDAVRMTLVRARRHFRAAYGADLDWLPPDDTTARGSGSM